MTLTVSNNSAVAFASHYLGENQKKLQSSIKKLASGKRIVGGAEDPGTLSVSMKLNAAVTRLVGASNNVQMLYRLLKCKTACSKLRVESLTEWLK